MQDLFEVNLLSSWMCFAIGLIWLFVAMRHSVFAPLLHAAWLISWLAWACLWTIRTHPPLEWLSPEAVRASIMVLADLNTALLLFMAISLYRDDAFRWTRYVALGAATFGVICTAHYLFSLSSDSTEVPLTEDFSMSFSLLSPVLFGSVCLVKLHRETHMAQVAFIIAVVYALLQPPAYRAAVHPVDAPGMLLPESAQQQVLSLGESTMILLAIMKVAWFTSVSYIFTCVFAIRRRKRLWWFGYALFCILGVLLIWKALPDSGAWRSTIGPFLSDARGFMLLAGFLLAVINFLDKDD